MILALLVVVALLGVALMAWPRSSSSLPFSSSDRPGEFRACPDCTRELVARGGVRWTRAAGEPMREMAWGAACDAHPTERFAQATNFVTVAPTVVHAMTAPRRGPLAPIRRLVNRVRTWMWWRKVLKQSDGGEATW